MNSARYPRRSSGGRPAPRSSRAGNVSPRSLAPVALATRLAATRPRLTQSRRRRPAARTAHPTRSTLATASTRSSGTTARGAAGSGLRRLGAFAPRHVGGQDQRGDLPRRARRGGDGVGGVAGDVAGAYRRAHPARDGPRHAVDVRLQRRVVLLVVGRVVADDVDERRARPAGVVQVGEPVAEAGPEVQQRRRRLAGHAPVPVGGAGDDAFEQAEHAAHLGDRVERGDEVHLGRARVREAHVDAAVDERADQRLRSVHGVPPRLSRRACPG